MQLTHFTDLGLRVLMYLSHPEPQHPPVTISEIAERFEVSRNHLVKVVHFMSQQGWLLTTRGKGGGLALAQAPEAYRLGTLIQALEGATDLIDCADPPCRLRGRCQLKGLLDKALVAFFAVLDEYTLADATASPTHEVIVMLHQWRPTA